MSVRAVVIGIGNVHRRDDGIGPVVAEVIARQHIPGVQVRACPAEPAALLDAWAGADLAVIVDAAAGGSPGRVRRCTTADLTAATPVSSHDLSLAQTYELGLALGRAPQSVVVVTIDVADTGHGTGLSPAVAAALPEASAEVLAVLGSPALQAEESTHQSS